MKNESLKIETSQPRGQFEPLVDRLGRVHTALRLSVTDRCNIRFIEFMPLNASGRWEETDVLMGDEVRTLIEAELQQLIRDCVAAKKPSHGIGSDQFTKPEMAMYEIGG